MTTSEAELSICFSQLKLVDQPNGIIKPCSIAHSGSAWEDMPNRYPPHQSVYSRFYKWCDDGTLEAVFHMLNAGADHETLSIDSTCRYRWK